MKENKYDDDRFFEKYSQMPRSIGGLSAAGEWHQLKQLIPNLQGKRVLDLGCGYGWHCIYAASNGATSVVGIDISHKMLGVAKEKTTQMNVEYICAPIENYEYAPNTFDVVISSLAFHYVDNFCTIASKIYKCLSENGEFIFSVEHPVFTASGTQEWVCDAAGVPLHFPVDNYFLEGKRTAVFLGEEVTKYHKTLTTYLNSLLQVGFCITAVVEPQPSVEMLEQIPDMKNELRRPMMLLVSAKKASH